METKDIKQYIDGLFRREVKKTFNCIRTEVKEGLAEALDVKCQMVIKKFFREECKKCFHDLGREIRKDYTKFLHRFLREHKVFYKKADKCFKQISEDSGYSLKAIRCALKEFEKSKDIMEETFLSVYSNIKRNQFLYAYYPEEWNETFLEFKEKIKQENKEFEDLMKEDKNH